MLHALTTMVQLIEATKFTSHIIIASDNLELIKRNKIIGEYSTRLPGQYLASHMDLQCAIDHLILTYFPNSEIVHVKGHQDAHKTRLSWIETLNVRADAIATKTRFESRKLTHDK